MLASFARRFALACLSTAALALAASAATPGGTGTLGRAFEAALAAGRPDQAAALADSLVRTRERTGGLDPLRAAGVLDSLGRRVFLAGGPQGWTASERLFRGALARREGRLGARDPRVASSLSTLSILLGYLGRWPEGIALADSAAAIRAATLGERDPETASSLRQSGLLRFQSGDYAGAREPFERALAIELTLGPGAAAKVADAHNNLGELSRVLDDLEGAESHFKAGVAIARASLPATDAVRLALENNLAGLYKDVGRFDDAEPLLEAALATLESAPGDPATLAAARLNLAEVRRLQDHPADAAPLYERALEDATAALGPDHPDLVPFLNQAAVCEQELGRYARAESLFTRTGAIVDRALGADHPLRAQNLVDLAHLRLATGRPREADTLLARALGIRERTLGPAHPDVALVLLEQARAHATDAAGAGAADAPLARAVAILDSSRAYPDARLDAHAQRAERDAARGDLGAATADMRVALALLDSLRSRRGGDERTRVAFVANRLALFDRMLAWQLRQGDVAGALGTHERGRARVLLDQLAAGGVDLRASIPPALRGPLEAEERAAEARLAAAERALQDARWDPELAPRARLEALARIGARRDSAGEALDLARRRLEYASPLWHDVLSAQGAFPDVATLQSGLLPRDGILLVYHVGNAASELFVVPARGRPRAFPLEVDARAAAILGVPAGPLTGPALESIVAGTGARGREGVAGLLSGRTEGGFVELPLRGGAAPDSFELRLHALWRTLVPAAAWKRIASAQTALLVPDGALHLLAFEALVTRPSGHRRAARDWLDDGPALAYGPSATALWTLSRRPEQPWPDAGGAEVLSVSDVAYATAAAGSSHVRPWAPLPGTAAETRAIVAAFGPGRVDVLAGEAAREPAVREAIARHRFVHLATHGFVDEAGSRLVAGLVLAPPPAPDPDAGDDGALELFEIHRLALDADLAVLSACETARGRLVAGEGTFALSRAFLAAGAREVVASLWPVDDRSTAQLVGTLFRSLAAAGPRRRALDVARALRDAKRAVRRDPRWADPFYWAPFVLSGCRPAGAVSAARP